MEISKITEKIPQWVHKYRYPILILLVGMVLFMLPKRKIEEQILPTQSGEVQRFDTAQQLAQILGQIEGVGKVKILLTLSEGEKTIYQHNEDASSGDSTSSVRQETVIITDSERNQQALITQVLPPMYQGAVIVCQGADLPAVKWAVVEAVSKATGLGADRISVLKMK